MNRPYDYYSYNSSYNGDGALKQSHDENAKAIRTTDSGLPFGASRFDAVVDAQGNYTSITYYADMLAEETKVVFNADSSSSLNSTYFIIYAGRDKTKYYVWYSVNGNGVNPNIPDSTGIKVDLVENDPAAVVALATKNAFTTNSLPFSMSQSSSTITFTANHKGNTTDATAETSGFNVTVMTQGTTETRATVELEYDADCNVIGYSQDVNMGG